MGTDNERLSGHPAETAGRRIGARLRELRTAQRYSQAALAGVMVRHGFPWYQTTVHRIESGRRQLLVSEAETLAEILGVPLGSFSERAAS